MAVTGIREMSTLATPPEDRHPILTYVGPYYGQAGRRRDPPRAAARGPGVLRAQPRVDPSTGSPRSWPSSCPRRGSRSPTASWASTQLEQVIVDFWERQVRRAGFHDDHRDRARHREREHAHHRPRRQVRALPAAPAARARSGRGRERAYAYFLYDENKPLSETAHGPAFDHRGEQRARLRHAGRAQGPRDPRRRQPARRRAVGPHRGRRLRPLPADDRRGRSPRSVARSPRADRAAARAAGRMPASPRTTSSSERLRLEAYQKLSTASASGVRRGRAGSPSSRSWPTATASCPLEVQNLVAVSRLRRAAQKAGLSDVDR